jgi:hypothetical protein
MKGSPVLAGIVQGEHCQVPWATGATGATRLCETADGRVGNDPWHLLGRNETEEI